MTLKSYLWGMRIGWAISLAAWALVFTNIDPEKSGAPGWLLFYVSGFLFLASTFVLLLTWIWQKMQKDKDESMVFIGVSFRQGVLLSLYEISNSSPETIICFTLLLFISETNFVTDIWLGVDVGI